MEKSFKKISAKNRRFFGKNRKNSDIFPKKSDFSEIWDKLYFRSLRGKKLKTVAKQASELKKSVLWEKIIHI